MNQCSNCGEENPSMSFDHSMFDDNNLATCFECKLKFCMCCTASNANHIFCNEHWRCKTKLYWKFIINSVVSDVRRKKIVKKNLQSQMPECLIDIINSKLIILE